MKKHSDSQGRRDTLIQITMMVLVSGLDAPPSITATITTTGDTCWKKKHSDSFLENDESHGLMKKRKKRKKMMANQRDAGSSWLPAKDYKQRHQQQAPLIVLVVGKSVANWQRAEKCLPFILSISCACIVITHSAFFQHISHICTASGVLIVVLMWVRQSSGLFIRRSASFVNIQHDSRCILGRF